MIGLNARVTHCRGCNDHLGEHRRTQATSNSLECAEKNAEKCGHVTKTFLYFYNVLQYSSTVLTLRTSEIKPQQSKNILRKPYELVKMSGDVSITQELATVRGK